MQNERTPEAIIDRDDIVAAAIEWHLRQSGIGGAELDAAGWEDFIAWLETSPAHAAAYDRLVADDAALPEVTHAFPAAAPVVVPMPVRGSPRRWGWAVGGTAIAASMVALLLSMAMPHQTGSYTVATAAGERRTVTLPDGTQVEMNGGTRLTLDRGDTRMAKLDAGEAMFRVRHDAAAPFTVRSGDLAIRDVGTVFNVVREGQRLGVQVGEGSVMFQPDGAAIVLKPGQAVTADEANHSLKLGTVAADSVGGWRDGRMAFAGDSVGAVFAAVERRYGTHVTLESGLSARPFTGMVVMSGSAERDIPHLAALIGAGWRRDGRQWILAPETPR